MKQNLLILIVVTGLGIHPILNAQTSDPVRQATQTNEKKSDKGIIDEQTAEFLVKSADARMMDKLEGSMAAKKGTTAAVREYGMQMVKDQSTLLAKIKQLAASKNITLPSGISKKKQDGKEQLSKKTEEAFDRKFISMMKIDHERDIKIFTEATRSKDKAVSNFAMKYLPLIQSHLDKVKALDKKQN